MATSLAAWNREHFGCIFRRKRRLYARIDGIQRKLVIRFSQNLFKLDLKLRQDLDLVLLQEELLWFQKSREEWLVSGDRNTKYYDASTNVKRGRNTISTLRSAPDSAVWISEPSILQEHVYLYFYNLFQEEQNAASIALPRGMLPVISETHYQSLDAEYNTEEIRQAVFAMAPFKAPGPDGLPAGFYQRMWHIVGDSVAEFAITFFVTGHIPSKVNDTKLVLIPKVASLEYINQFRPISLCNVSYKLLTKVLANRLKIILPHVIAPNQSSFVPGRQISNNIVIYSMHRKGSGSGYMTLNIDLEKAYDWLSWEFIRDTLIDLGLSDSWVRNILACVTTSSMSVAWNSQTTQWFKPGRGIRQGDPIAPYLFVMCVERLGHLISHSVSKTEWKPISLSCNGPAISHLFFADDMVLFAEASDQQIHHILNCLDRFCASSGQRVNFAKSNIYFSKNVTHEMADRLSRILGTPITTNLGKYLGTPSIHGRIATSDYQYVLDRVSSRLEGRKTKTLSLAGRITLAKSVLTSMPLHVMQTTMLPKALCDSIDKVVRRFIWGGTSEHRSINLVKWETVTTPMHQGGLGIRRMSVMNRAFMAKIGWRILQEPTSLWVRVVSSKYMRNRNDLKSMVAKSGASPLWRGVVAAHPLLQAGIRRVVGNGCSTLFWRDPWLNAQNLMEVCSSLPSLVNSYKPVSYYWDPFQGWKWELLSCYLPSYWLQRIGAIRLKMGDNHRDFNRWGLTASGEFSVATAYQLGARHNAGAATNA